MTDGGIYLQQNDELVPMREETYEAESILQDWLADYPRLLAGEQMNPDTPRQWLLIAQEAGIPDHKDGGGRWSADHLFIDQEAIPTLVEVKRSSDSRIRREVVGQALDYVSHACINWSAEILATQFEETWSERQLDPDDVLEDLIGDDSAEEFWHRAESNLRSKRVRILFVADAIPSELKRVVEFLNEGFSNTEVFAIEVAQFTGEESRAFVPRLYGQTEEAREAKGTTRYDGAISNESEFRADIQDKLESGAVSQELVDAYYELYEFAQELGEVQINRTKNASFKLLVEEHQGDAGGNPGVFSANIGGMLKMWLAKMPLPEEGESSDVAWSRTDYEAYEERFGQLDGQIDKNSADIEVLTMGDNLERFKSMTEEFVNRCKEADRNSGQH